MKLFDTTLERLQSSLDVRLARQNVLGGNLANVDTPGYQPRELDFAEAMRARSAELAASAAASLPAAPPVEGHLSVSQTGLAPDATTRLVKVAPGEGGLDGNGVDLDRTMVELSRNALLYGASTRAAGKKLAILRYVAGDGIG
ncbi:MAG: flagellar basal body rod protein FlgB [Myxococcaceae bacterium]|nr:flagellar basal body rod protein FlgB [Myxococcaceae bacterium]MCA3015487.1 flagellar basal body rod protein FlgB [Myxococcaceae bacterium]